MVTEFKKINYGKAKKDANISYLGGTRQSTKINLSFLNGVSTYSVYLAPSTLARDKKHPSINNCPYSKMCAHSCLNGSGQNKCATLALHGMDGLSHVDRARIRKTHLFYDNRDKFMELFIHELLREKKYAEKRGMKFAVRINCTSDLSPKLFRYNGYNVLDLFPDVQFYDYTKVPTRLKLTEKYPNYYLVFSYDGTNWDVCEEWLQKGGNVAVVFDLYDNKGKQTLPSTWRGYKVIDGNKHDARFADGYNGVIVGLHYHRVANDYISGKYKPEITPFIIREV